MNDWIEAVKAELNIESEVDVDALLLVARDAAHLIQRPAAPITTYLVGMAVANGAAFSDAIAKVTALAKSWPNGQ